MTPIDNYIKENSLELSLLMKTRKVIYLDTNFWIELRDENMKIEANDRRFLNKVTELVESKKCIFPISEITFYEIMKQDLKKRNMTIKLVDKFSEGISIINNEERKKIEFRHWIQKKTGTETYELNELIWSSVSFAALGYNFLSKVKTNSFHKPFYDYVSNISLLEVTLGNNTKFNFKDKTIDLNNDIKNHEGENKTFEELFLSELGGYLDLHEYSINEVVNELMYNAFYKKTGRFPTDEEKNAVANHNYKSLVYYSFKMGKITNELPVIHIIPLLNAWRRWKKIKYYKDGHDTIDFLHASFALPYSDYFFTERKLFSRITELKLDNLYGCKVEHNLSKAMEILNSIE